MAYILLERRKWISNNEPPIYFNMYYDMYRSGSNMYYRLKVVVEPVTGANYFGYNIYDNITLNSGSQGAYLLKNNLPNQWSSSITHETNWITVSNKYSGTVPVSFRFYSTTYTPRDETRSFDLPIVAFSPPTNITSFSTKPNPCKDDESCSLSWSGATGGDGNIAYYELYARKYNGSTWSNYIWISNVYGASYTHNIKNTYPDIKDGNIIQYKIITVSNVSGYYSSGVECTPTLSIIASAQCRIKINDVWKKGIVYIKVNGVWKKATGLYIKINGVWKKCI